METQNKPELQTVRTVKNSPLPRSPVIDSEQQLQCIQPAQTRFAPRGIGNCIFFWNSIVQLRMVEEKKNGDGDN